MVGAKVIGKGPWRHRAFGHVARACKGRLASLCGVSGTLPIAIYFFGFCIGSPAALSLISTSMRSVPI